MNEEERRQHVKQMQLNAMRRRQAQDEPAVAEEDARSGLGKVIDEIGIFGVWVVVTIGYIPITYLLIHPDYLGRPSEITTTLEYIKQSASPLWAFIEVIIVAILGYLYYAAVTCALLEKYDLHFSMWKFCMFSAFSLVAMLVFAIIFEELLPDSYHTDDLTIGEYLFYSFGSFITGFLGLAFGFRVILKLEIMDTCKLSSIATVLAVASAILMLVLFGFTLDADHPIVTGVPSG